MGKEKTEGKGASQIERMTDEKKEKFKEEYKELRANAVVRIEELNRIGWEGYQGFVAISETQEEAWRDSITSAEWIIKMMDELNEKIT